MTTYGVTNEGFKLKRLSDILLEMQAGLQEIFPDANITGESVFGQILGLFSAAEAQDWEAFQLVSNQFDPSNARGADLSSLVQLNGLIRLSSKASTVVLECSGTDGTVIPSGSMVTNPTRSETYTTTLPGTISGGTVLISAIGLDTSSAAAGTLTTIVNPLSGWLSATNPDDAESGRLVESDPDLIMRRDNSTLAPSQSVVESIYGNLLNIPDVKFARVYINEENTTDFRGIPGHSISAVVVGGDDISIADVLFRRKPAGISTHGNTDINVVDNQGFMYPMKYIRPIEIPIYMTVNLTTDSNFPVDGAQQIVDAIIAYADGGADQVGALDFGNKDGFPPGQDVIFTRLFTPLNSVPGHRVDSMFIGTSAAPTGTTDIGIDYDQVSAWDTIMIQVVIL